MFDNDDPPILLFLLLAFGAWLVWLYWSQREDPQVRARRLEEEARLKREAGEKRDRLIRQPIPPDIERAMRDYLRSGNFVGEEHSPLAYVGYRVGKTKGLAPRDRQRRLKVCFRMEIPRELSSNYRGWGRPATHQRFASMCQHLSMLANMRRHRRNYENAVADWEADKTWFRSEFGDMAISFGKHGFGR